MTGNRRPLGAAGARASRVSVRSASSLAVAAGVGHTLRLTRMTGTGSGGCPRLDRCDVPAHIDERGPQHLNSRHPRRADPDHPHGGRLRQARTRGSSGRRLGGCPRSEARSAAHRLTRKNRLRSRPAQNRLSGPGLVDSSAARPWTSRRTTRTVALSGCSVPESARACGRLIEIGRQFGAGDWTSLSRQRHVRSGHPQHRRWPGGRGSYDAATGRRRSARRSSPRAWPRMIRRRTRSPPGPW